MAEDLSPQRKELSDEIHNKGILFSSGLIAGEALMGVGIAAIVFFAGGNRLALVDGAPAWPGFLVLLYVAVLLAYVGYREFDLSGFRQRYRELVR